MEMRPGCWPDTSAAAAVHRHAVVAAADAVALAASTAAADLASSVAVPPSCCWGWAAEKELKGKERKILFPLYK